MGCSADQTRLNAQKSTGPKTERGKAIASRNSITHGILSKTPPLLITEDREQYDALIAGLVETYTPVGPLEEMLIRQIAIAYLRQERLWSVEAAIANIEIIKQQKALNYPDQRLPSNLDIALESLTAGHSSNVITRRSLLQAELKFLLPYLDDMRSHLTLDHMDERSAELVLDFTDLRNEAKQLCTEEFPWWSAVENIADTGCDQLDDDLEALNQNLIELVKQLTGRVKELEGAIAAIDQLDKAHDEARITEQSIQNPDRFARYQTAISRDLHLAIDRLIDLQERRHNQASISSFGQN